MRNYWSRIRILNKLPTDDVKVNVSLDISSDIISDLLQNVPIFDDKDDTEYIVDSDEDEDDSDIAVKTKQQIGKIRRKGKAKEKGKGKAKEKGKGKGKGKIKEYEKRTNNGNKKGREEINFKETVKGEKRKWSDSDSEFEGDGTCQNITSDNEENCSDSEFEDVFGLDEINVEGDSFNETKMDNRKRLVKKKKLDEDNSSDSDFDEDDHEEFTTARRTSKELRYEKRFYLIKVPCPSTLEGNKHVVDLFKNFLRKTYSITAWDRKSSTYRSSLGFLFTYDDSLLQYELKRDENFKLEQFIDFNNERFRELGDPTDWIMSIAGVTGKENPDDRIAMDKAWKRFNLFIKDQLINSRPPVESDVNLLHRFHYVINNLDTIYKKTDKGKVSSAAKVVSNLNKRERENAEEYASPNKRLLEKDATKKWFNSEIYKEELATITNIWKEAINEEKISKKNFTRLGMFVKFQLMLTSKNRPSVFKFTNQQYLMRSSLWLNEDSSASLESLLQLSDYPTEPPKDNPNKPPNSWIIKLSGKGTGIKNQEAQVIFINKPCQSLLDKYDDIKEILFQDVEIDKSYFVNFDSNPMSDIPTTRGSLWEKYATVSGLPKATMNTVRRELEHKVQSSPVALSRIRDIQSHSQTTGSGAYDKVSPIFRATYMNHVSQEEGNNIEDDDLELVEKVKKIRNQREKIQKQKCQEALEKMKKNKKSRKQISKTTRLLREDRVFLEELFLNENYSEMYNAVKSIFPKIQEFTRLFYRLVDGPNKLMSDDVRLKLLEVEQRIFLTVKEDIEKEYEKLWQKKDKAMNRYADRKICLIIRNSFYFQNKNKNLYEKNVFVFSKKKK